MLFGLILALDNSWDRKNPCNNCIMCLNQNLLLEKGFRSRVKWFVIVWRIRITLTYLSKWGKPHNAIVPCDVESCLANDFKLTLLSHVKMLTTLGCLSLEAKCKGVFPLLSSSLISISRSSLLSTLISEIRASTLLDLFFSYLALQKVILSILPTHFTKHPTAVDLF